MSSKPIPATINARALSSGTVELPVAGSAVVVTVVVVGATVVLGTVVVVVVGSRVGGYVFGVVVVVVGTVVVVVVTGTVVVVVVVGAVVVVVVVVVGTHPCGRLAVLTSSELLNVTITDVAASGASVVWPFIRVVSGPWLKSM